MEHAIGAALRVSRNISSRLRLHQSAIFRALSGTVRLDLVLQPFPQPLPNLVIVALRPAFAQTCPRNHKLFEYALVPCSG